MEKIKKFFSKLQKEDAAVKKMWLIILTSASMVFVLAIWGFSLNMTIKTLNSNEKQMAEKDLPAQMGDFMAILKNSADLLSKETGLKLSKVIDSVQTIANKTNSITINKADNNLFIKKDLEEITPSKLP